MGEELDGPQAPPLQPAHRRQVTLLSALMQLGLLIVCASAIYTLQPNLTIRQWTGLIALAVVMLICAIGSRGRCSFRDWGKLVTALGAVLVLSLARDPQLAEQPWAESLPTWLLNAGPGLATVGVIIAVVFGVLFLRTLANYLGHAHTPPFIRAMNWAALIVLVLGLGMYLMLRHIYEMDPVALAMLLGNVVQYYLLLWVVLNSSGRTTVGAAPQIYIALAILLAFARNVLAGMVFGGGEA